MCSWVLKLHDFREEGRLPPIPNNSDVPLRNRGEEQEPVRISELSSLLLSMDAHLLTKIWIPCWERHGCLRNFYLSCDYDDWVRCERRFLISESDPAYLEGMLADWVMIQSIREQGISFMHSSGLCDCRGRIFWVLVHADILTSFLWI